MGGKKEGRPAGPPGYTDYVEDAIAVHNHAYGYTRGDREWCDVLGDPVCEWVDLSYGSDGNWGTAAHLVGSQLLLSNRECYQVCEAWYRQHFPPANGRAAAFAHTQGITLLPESCTNNGEIWVKYEIDADGTGNSERTIQCCAGNSCDWQVIGTVNDPGMWIEDFGMYYADECDSTQYCCSNGQYEPAGISCQTPTGQQGQCNSVGVCITTTCDPTFLPSTDTRCEGVWFVQANECGETQQAIGTKPRNTAADTNCNSCIDDSEFPVAVNNWKQQTGEITDAIFPNIVNQWKTQGGC